MATEILWMIPDFWSKFRFVLSCQKQSSLINFPCPFERNVYSLLQGNTLYVSERPSLPILLSSLVVSLLLCVLFFQLGCLFYYLQRHKVIFNYDSAFSFPLSPLTFALFVLKLYHQGHLIYNNSEFLIDRSFCYHHYYCPFMFKNASCLKIVF